MLLSGFITRWKHILSTAAVYLAAPLTKGDLVCLGKWWRAYGASIILIAF
jgi:hypothetical protein